LRDQALRAAASACLNISEGAGRKGSADKARVYAIARGENCEAAAALDIALAAGLCCAESAWRGLAHAKAVHALLSGLIRRFSQSSE
jgi:four helix bundle protein